MTQDGGPGKVLRPPSGESAIRQIRFSIASLLGLVLSVAVAFAALRASTDAWDAGVFGLAVIGLLTSVLLAVHHGGSRRAKNNRYASFASGDQGERTPSTANMHLRHRHSSSPRKCTQKLRSTRAKEYRPRTSVLQSRACIMPWPS